MTNIWELSATQNNGSGFEPKGQRMPHDENNPEDDDYYYKEDFPDEYDSDGLDNEW